MPLVDPQTSDTSGPSEAEDQEWQLCLERARQRGLEAVRLDAEKLDHELLQSMPRELLVNYRVLPLARQGFELTLAMADPLDVVGEDMVRQISGCRVTPVVAMEREILAALAGKLGQKQSELDTILEQIPDSYDITYLEATDAEAEQPEEAEPEGPIIQLVNSIIGDAIRMKASDIHVEPQPDSLRVRYRLDGTLRTIVELPKRVQSACISRMKLMSGIDISETRKPQDGRARALVQEREVDLRVSSLPTFRGEKIVMRILDSRSVVTRLEDLGFLDSDGERLQTVLAASQGMILCTGPTGSGKTSTLYAALLHLNDEGDNLITVEDPVEYQLPGVNQVQVNVRAGLTFASSLRSILRQDPDVVLIGEIRDLETAEIAVQAAQTGHLVLSTLHTNDALSTVSRLLLMGVAPYMLASALLCVIAQRLVRKLCPQCSRPGDVSESSLRLLHAAGVLEPPRNARVAVGCAHCHYIGYKGRLGLFEMLLVTDRVRELLLAGSNERELERVARQEGMSSLLQDGLRKCELGQTSLEEVLRVITVRHVGGRCCPGCAASVPPEMSMCVHCGQVLDRLCPHCSTRMELQWNYCPGCRQAVPAPPESTPRSQRPAAIEPVPQPTGPDEVLAEATSVRRRALLVSADEQVFEELRGHPWGIPLEWQWCASPQLADRVLHEEGNTYELLLIDYDSGPSQVETWLEVLRSSYPQLSLWLLETPGPEGLVGLHCPVDEFVTRPLDLHRLEARLRQGALP